MRPRVSSLGEGGGAIPGRARGIATLAAALGLLAAARPPPSPAAVFVVHNPDEFFNALTTAGRNGEPDSVLVTGGLYRFTRPLDYIPLETEHYPIAIGGLPADKPVLDGQGVTSLLNINLAPRLCYVGDSEADVSVSDMVFRNANGTRWASSGRSFGGLRIYASKADILVQGCEFYANHAAPPDGGGAIEISSSYYSVGPMPPVSIRLINNVVAWNTASANGGGVWMSLQMHPDDKCAYLIHNTFVGNHSTQTGGGAFVTSYSGARVWAWNNIFHQNRAATTDDLFLGNRDDSIGSYAYNVIWEFDCLDWDHMDLPYWNWDTDPGLIGPCHLARDAFALDQGYNGAPQEPAADREGDLRPVDGDGDGTARVDMGADEWDPANPIDPAAYHTDFDGDGVSDGGFYRPSRGFWSIRGSTRFYFGSSSDQPVCADYNGDRIADAAFFRPGDGSWSVRGWTRFYFGESPDRPFTGDFDGNGLVEAACFRPSDSRWSIRGITRFYFGAASDLPVVGDYDGDGTGDPAIWRPADFSWAVRNVSRFCFGTAGDVPVPGDYDGDRTWEAGVFRAGVPLWAVRAVTRVYFGAAGDQPVPMNADADRADEIAIFRPSSSLWAVRGGTRFYLGTAGDIPVTR